MSAELIDDPNFNSSVSWIKPDWLITAGFALKNSGTGIDALTEVAPFTVKIGQRYKVVLVITTLSGSSYVQVSIGSVSSQQFNTTGTKEFYLTATTTGQFYLIGNGGDQNIAVNSCSVKEIVPIPKAMHHYKQMAEA